MLAAFLVLRYRYGMESITRLFVIGVVLDTAGIVALGVWDFAGTGRVSATLFTRPERRSASRQPRARAGARDSTSLGHGSTVAQTCDRWVAHRTGSSRKRERSQAGYQPAVPGPP